MDFKKNRNLLLYLLVFIRPFISSQAFPETERGFLVIFIFLTLSFLKGIRYKKNNLILDLALFLYVTGAVFSLLFSSDRLNSLSSAPRYFIGITFFLITLTLNPTETKRVLRIIFSSGLIISLYGIYQYLLGFSQTAEYVIKTNPYFFTNHLIRNYLLSWRVFSTFFSPNMLAGYLIMLIPLSIGHISETKKEKKFIFYLGTGTMFTALLLTKSLGGILSSGLSFFILFLFFKSKPILPKKHLFLGLIILSLFILPIIFSRADRLFNFCNPHNSFLQRYNFIRVSLRIIKDNLFWGVGMGSFGNFFMHYRNNYDIRTNYAHNFILQTQAETGILGSSGLFLLILLFLQDIILLKKYNFSLLKFSLLWAGLSFLIHNLIDVSFFFPEVAVFFWILWACFKNLSE